MSLEKNLFIANVLYKKNSGYTEITQDVLPFIS